MSEPSKACSKCSTVKPLSAFYQDKRTKDGRSPACADCNRAANARWRAANPGYFTHWHRTRRLGVDITTSEVAEMLARQGGVCAICGQPETDPGRDSLALDHCHATGLARGLLCRRCNTGLGLLGDTEEGLLRALDYLRRSTPSPTPTRPVGTAGSGLS